MFVLKPRHFVTVATKWDVAKLKYSLANGCSHQQPSYQSALSIAHLVIFAIMLLRYNYDYKTIYFQRVRLFTGSRIIYGILH